MTALRKSRWGCKHNLHLNVQFGICTDDEHTVRLHSMMDCSTDSLQQAVACLSSIGVPRQPAHGSCDSQPTAQHRKDVAPCQYGGICLVPWDTLHALSQRWNRAMSFHCFMLHAHLASRTTLGVIHSTHNNAITTAVHLLCWQMSFRQEIAATHFQITSSHSPSLLWLKGKYHLIFKKCSCYERVYDKHFNDFK